MQSRFIALALVLWVSLMMLAGTSMGATEVPRMTIDELKARIGSPDLVIIDVRISHDWDDSTTMIKGAVREDPSRLGSWIDKYPKGKTIVLYCA